MKILFLVFVLYLITGLYLTLKYTMKDVELTPNGTAEIIGAIIGVIIGGVFVVIVSPIYFVYGFVGEICRLILEGTEQ